MGQLEAIYALTEPQLPGRRVIGLSQTIGEDKRTGELVDVDMTLWYLARERRVRRPRRDRAKHNGRPRKRRD